MTREERLKEYSAVLSQPDVKPEHLIAAYDMISADLTSASENEALVTQLKAQVDELKTVNHKLFLRVTGDPDGTTTVGEKTTRPASEVFAEMIEKGEL